MITRKCPCCHKKTIKPLKFYNWNVCSHCKAKIKSWNLSSILFACLLFLHVVLNAMTFSIFCFILFYALFDSMISPLWTPLSVVEKTENNDMDFIKKV